MKQLMMKQCKLFKKKEKFVLILFFVSVFSIVQNYSHFFEFH